MGRNAGFGHLFDAFERDPPLADGDRRILCGIRREFLRHHPFGDIGIIKQTVGLKRGFHVLGIAAQIVVIGEEVDFVDRFMKNSLRFGVRENSVPSIYFDT